MRRLLARLALVLRGSPRPNLAPDPVNGYAVLETAASLPVSKWSYLWDPPSVRHLGPMAQDFHAAFRLGDNPRKIDMVDANGVNLVAIQALYRKVTALEAEVAMLKERLPA